MKYMSIIMSLALFFVHDAYSMFRVSNVSCRTKVLSHKIHENYRTSCLPRMTQEKLAKRPYETIEFEVTEFNMFKEAFDERNNRLKDIHDRLGSLENTFVQYA